MNVIDKMVILPYERYESLISSSTTTDQEKDTINSSTQTSTFQEALNTHSLPEKEDFISQIGEGDHQDDKSVKEIMPTIQQDIEREKEIKPTTRLEKQRKRPPPGIPDKRKIKWKIFKTK